MRPEPKPGIMDIAAYVPGRSYAAGFDRPLKLSANENPFGCSPAAREAYLAAASELHLYPDSRTSALRAAIAKKFDLEPERLVFGAGSDEIFAMATQTYLQPGDNIVQPQFGFAAWAIAARAAGGIVKSAPEPDYAPSVDTILAAIDDRTRIVFFANPANPTGSWLRFAEIERLHASMPAQCLLLLDGAYAECAADLDGFSDGLAWARDKENVFVTRTFSKIYGLAGLRIGWGCAPTHVATALDRIRLPFSVPRPGEAAAVAALEDEAFVAKSLAQMRKARAQLEQGLSALGVRTLPSATNFVTAHFGSAERAQRIEGQLAQAGILVRGLKTYAMPECLRITAGGDDQVERVLTALSGLV